MIADISCRYNTFYVLYPIGITSECTLIYQALGPAAGIDPLFRYFLIAVLVIYVPGMSCDIEIVNDAQNVADEFARLLRPLYAHDCPAPKGSSRKEAG